jgi:hypothetical protein
MFVAASDEKWMRLKGIGSGRETTVAAPPA